MQIIGLPSTNSLDKVEKSGSIPTAMKQATTESVKINSVILDRVRKIARENERTIAAQLRILLHVGLEMYYKEKAK